VRKAIPAGQITPLAAGAADNGSRRVCSEGMGWLCSPVRCNLPGT